MSDRIDISDISKLQLRDGSEVLGVYETGNTGKGSLLVVYREIRDNTVSCACVYPKGSYWSEDTSNLDLILKPEPKIEGRCFVYFRQTGSVTQSNTRRSVADLIDDRNYDIAHGIRVSEIQTIEAYF